MRQPVIMDETAMRRALMRISHEIIEKNESAENICIVGIRRRGIPLADIIASNLRSLGVQVETGTLDITRYRDDLSTICDDTAVSAVELDFVIENKIVVLVDDVIFTGRTARAAMEAVITKGRPARIQLASLVDRGHRELPIRADYVGKNVPTAKSEIICVNIPPYDNEMKVIIERNDAD